MTENSAGTRPDIAPLLPIAAVALALAIFILDAVTALDMAVAVLYVVVVLMAAKVLDRRGVLLVSAGCLALTLVAYLIAHGLTMTTALGRCLVSVSAIGITTFLALKDQAAAIGLRGQARLLDLTHDTIFVRDMDDVITYWNRAAEELYGWQRQEALGRNSHQLMQTTFPAPLQAIRAELLATGRWEGDISHAKRDGTRVIVTSRWSLQRDERGQPVAIMETNNDITKRKLAEEKLLRAERELRTTIDTIPALVVAARPDGTIDFINARWSEQGFAEAHLRSGLAVVVHPDDLAEIAAKRARSLATGEPYQAEVRLRKANGEYRWYVVQAVTLRDETGTVVKRYSLATDIEDRKRAEDALRRSEALLAETQELSRTGSIGFDPATEEVIWSAEGARILGYDPSTEPTLTLVLQRVHPDDVWLAQRSIDRAYRGEPDTEFDIRLRLPEGVVKYVHVVPHAARDAFAGRVLRALIDVTAAREAEAALHRAQAALAHVTRVTTLGEVTASIAHEVNQPLAAIVTNGQSCLLWLGREVPDLDEVRAGTKRIIADAERASQVIRRIRELARKTDLQVVALDLNEVIDEAILLVRREVLDHGISLQLDLASALPPVLGDRVQLQQVIINLVINAIQAMDPVTDRPRELVIRSRAQQADQILVAVQDTGIGIEPENMRQLFHTFFTTKAGGMGMGLSICRSIIEAHGGPVPGPPFSSPWRRCVRKGTPRRRVRARDNGELSKGTSQPTKL
jgi:PAS domain S-box-containing protein